MSLAALALLLVVPAQVELRGQPEPLSGTVTEVTLGGVRVSLGPGQDEVIGWDRIRAVGGEHADEAALFMDYADKAWRARTRLMRGDFVSAEPLFEELFAVYEGRTGPTASVVAEGLARARLRRGALTAAVRPWLAYLRARRGTGANALGARPLADPATGLIPTLAPIFLSGPGTEALANADLSNLVAAGTINPSDTTAVYAQWYQFAARIEGTARPALPKLDTNDPGLRLVSAIVLARRGDPAQRKAARATLDTIASKGRHDWMRAWAWAGLGRSLIGETDRALRLRGVIAMLHLPAAYATDQPYLSGLCLAESALTLDELGLLAESQRLVVELRDHYRGHPALSWPPLNAIDPTGRPAPEPMAQRPSAPRAVAHLMNGAP